MGLGEVGAKLAELFAALVECFGYAGTFLVAIVVYSSLRAYFSRSFVCPRDAALPAPVTAEEFAECGLGPVGGAGDGVGTGASSGTGSGTSGGSDSSAGGGAGGGRGTRSSHRHQLEKLYHAFQAVRDDLKAQLDAAQALDGRTAPLDSGPPSTTARAARGNR